MENNTRAQRLAKQIKVLMANMFLKSEVKDPVLFDKIIMMNHVWVSDDLSLAKVFVSSDVSKEILTALNKNVHVFRKRIGKEIKIKKAPDIRFVIDTHLEKAKKIDDLFSLIK